MANLVDVEQYNTVISDMADTTEALLVPTASFSVVLSLSIAVLVWGIDRLISRFRQI